MRVLDPIYLHILAFLHDIFIGLSCFSVGRLKFKPN